MGHDQRHWGKRLSGDGHERFDPLSTFKVPSVERGTAAVAEETGRRAALRAVSRGRVDILIIGNGIAGCAAAMQARQHEPGAEILVVTEQPHPTINTPALKQFGAGHLELEQLLAQPPGTERRLRIGVIQQHVERIDVRSRQVYLRGGQHIQYERLLLATGSRPVGFPSLPGADFDGVMTLHTLRDYLDLRRRLPVTSHAIVCGGGYHAAESALLLRQANVRVTWLIRGRSILAGQLDTPSSDLLLQQVQRQGVEVRLETEAAGIVGRLGVAAGVLSTDGEFIPGELIIAATGVRPDTMLVQGTDMAMQARHGLRVDERLQTVMPNVYAAGAVASILDPQSRQRDSRAQWYFAFQQGRLAGASLAGASIPEDARTAATGAFWHATHLGKLAVVSAGAPMLSERDHDDIEIAGNGSAAFHRRIVLRGDHLVGYLAVGAHPPSGLAIKRIIDERLDVRAIRKQLLSEDFDVPAFLRKRHIHFLQERADLPVAPTPATMPIGRAQDLQAQLYPA
ncbi:MAG TPA: NAD(P)/FAD-dependent oxidoreductase [Ktedonobacterales bacterium]|nr:NAD(P)/FAD-dependent oxidoreductase [Ktedonobacterales bacterium]